MDKPLPSLPLPENPKSLIQVKVTLNPPAQAQGNIRRRRPSRPVYKKEWQLVYGESNFTLTLRLSKPINIDFLKESIRELLRLEIGEIIRLKYEEYEGGDKITVLDREDIKECLRRGVLFVS
jgi:hypothetical protein